VVTKIKIKIMITYDWNCKTVEAYTKKEGNENVVHKIHYRVIGSKEGFNSTKLGVVPLETSDIANFKVFEDLIHEDLISWVKENIGEERVLEIENNLSKKVDLLITPESKTFTIS
jgi:hypothetical protein